MVFDEAIKSEATEKKKDLLKKMISKKEELRGKIKEAKDEGQVNKHKQTIDRLDTMIEKIEQNIKGEGEKKD